MRSARPTEAFAAYAVAADAWRELGDRRRQAEVLMAVGAGHRAHRDSPSALTAFAAAAELWREVGDRPRQAEALMGQGREHGRGPAAVAAYTQAGTIYRQLWRPADWARARRARRRAAG
jgi:hypothetical protein